MDAIHSNRKEKIQEVKTKVLRKLYDTKELREGTVNRMVQSEDLINVDREFSLSKTQKGKQHSDSNPTGKRVPKTDFSVREKKMKEAKEKYRKGYYNSPEVFSKVAQRLIDLLGA